MLLGVIGFVLPPTLAKIYDCGQLDEVKLVLRYSLKYFLLFAIPFVCGSAVVGRHVLALLSTQDIANKGHLIIPIIALSTLLYGANTVNTSRLSLVKKTKNIGTVWITAGLTNLILNIAIVPHWGIIGAAVTTLITYTLVFVVMTYLSGLEFGFDPDLVFICKSIVSAAVMCFFLIIINPSGTFALIFSVILGSFIFFLSLYLLNGFNRKEIDFFKYFCFDVLLERVKT